MLRSYVKELKYELCYMQCYIWSVFVKDLPINGHGGQIEHACSYCDNSDEIVDMTICWSEIPKI